MSDPRERFDLYDAREYRVIGRAARGECHGNPALVHAVARVHVVDRAGRLLLQKRSAAKDIQPGRWDTAVGGHLQPGEDAETAAGAKCKRNWAWRRDGAKRSASLPVAHGDGIGVGHHLCRPP